MSRDEAGRQVIDTATEIIRIARIPVTDASLDWSSCGGDDDDAPPFQAIITGNIPGKPTDAEADQQVDAWVKLLQSHGWNFETIPSTGARGGNKGDYGVNLQPYNSLTAVDPGASFTVRGPCQIEGMDGSEPGPDVTAIITGKAPNYSSSQPIPTYNPAAPNTASPTS